ncbi:MAG: Gfo/Idh/MocA family oxidoreductase [Clostridia bacterium]|nr:Gfo/Idh/MocA family oxidoreductase [Clostridia bacterium]
MIRTVIIGFAHMHVNEVALYIDGQPDTKLVGVADVPPKSPENTDKRYTRAWNLKNVADLSGAPVYEDYTKLLDELKPDYAYILCENAAKPDVCEQVAKRGVNIIVEKPMAADLAGAERICALEGQYGVEIAVNWPVAWRPYLAQLKNAVDNKLCGDLIKLRYINGHTGPLGKGAKHRGVTATAEEMSDEERGRIWWYKGDCGGGAFLDILCYGCYFTRWFFGKKPEGISSMGINLNTPYADCEDNTAAIFRYENAMSTAEGTWTIPRLIVPAGPQVLCTEGAVWCAGGADAGQHIEACTLSGEMVDVPQLPADDKMKNMPWHIASHVLHGTPIFETLTPAFNLEVMQMLDAAVKSNAGHTEVRP